MTDVGSEGPWVGPCTGGPLDGQTLISRYPKGVLVVNRPTDSAWVYDWDGTKFAARSDEPDELVEDGDADKNRWRAALEGNYDVMALPGSGDDE